jgi:hypothetical protein
MSQCWLVALIPREPDSWPTALSVWSTEAAAQAEIARLDALVEPLRAAADALYRRLETYGSRYAAEEYPELKAERRALSDAERALYTTHGLYFSPSYYNARDHHWQPIFEKTELPYDPST